MDGCMTKDKDLFHKIDTMTTIEIIKIQDQDMIASSNPIHKVAIVIHHDPKTTPALHIPQVISDLNFQHVRRMQRHAKR